jgi:hypothetical protein
VYLVDFRGAFVCAPRQESVALLPLRVVMMMVLKLFSPPPLF